MKSGSMLGDFKVVGGYDVRHVVRKWLKHFYPRHAYWGTLRVVTFERRHQRAEDRATGTDWSVGIADNQITYVAPYPPLVHEVSKAIMEEEKRMTSRETQAARAEWEQDWGDRQGMARRGDPTDPSTGEVRKPKY